MTAIKRLDLRAAGVCVWLALSVTACSLLPRYSDNRLQAVHMVAAEDMNGKTATAVDVVFIFDEELATQLPEVTARQWFTDKNSYLLRYPEKLTVFTYELVPLSFQVLFLNENEKLFPMAYEKAYKVLAYANYVQESKDFTVDITVFKRPLLSLEKEKITISESKQS